MATRSVGCHCSMYILISADRLRSSTSPSLTDAHLLIPNVDACYQPLLAIQTLPTPRTRVVSSGCIFQKSSVCSFVNPQGDVRKPRLSRSQLTSNLRSSHLQQSLSISITKPLQLLPRKNATLLNHLNKLQPHLGRREGIIHTKHNMLRLAIL